MPYKENYKIGKYLKKKTTRKVRLYLITFFVFYFQKLVFESINKKQFSCIFEIKNMFSQLKLKKKQFFEKKNTEICCYQDFNSNANSLNETDSLNQTRVFIDF